MVLFFFSPIFCDLTGETLVSDSSAKRYVFVDGHPVSLLYITSIIKKVVCVPWMKALLPGHF